MLQPRWHGYLSETNLCSSSQLKALVVNLSCRFLINISISFGTNLQFFTTNLEAQSCSTGALLDLKFGNLKLDNLTKIQNKREEILYLNPHQSGLIKRNLNKKEGVRAKIQYQIWITWKMIINQVWARIQYQILIYMQSKTSRKL